MRNVVKVGVSCTGARGVDWELYTPLFPASQRQFDCRMFADAQLVTHPM